MNYIPISELQLIAVLSQHIDKALKRMRQGLSMDARMELEAAQLAVMQFQRKAPPRNVLPINSDIHADGVTESMEPLL